MLPLQEKPGLHMQDLVASLFGTLHISMAPVHAVYVVLHLFGREVSERGRG